jgi:hypothetical protein
MLLELQNYLQKTPWPEAKDYLSKEKAEGGLALNIQEHSSDGRVLFKYNQIESPMAHPIVQEARGVILDKNDNWKVVTFPFKKFFNYEEGHAAAIDWTTARALEKVDGTCICLYYYEGKWCVQTLGRIEADGEVNQILKMTFSDLFFKYFCVTDFPFCSDYTYTFELATPFNRIVTRYDDVKIALLSIRHRLTLEETHLDDPIYTEICSRVKGVSLPKSFPMQSLKDVVDLARSLPQLDEGYVVVDAAFNRIKVKNPSYVAIAHLKESMLSSIRGLVAIALTNEGDEFLTYFPEYREKYEMITDEMLKIKEKLTNLYKETKDIVVQKDFALSLQASKLPFIHVLFSLRSGKIKSIDEGFSTIDPKYAIEALKLA